MRVCMCACVRQREADRQTDRGLCGVLFVCVYKSVSHAHAHTHTHIHMHEPPLLTHTRTQLPRYLPTLFFWLFAYKLYAGPISWRTVVLADREAYIGRFDRSVEKSLLRSYI